MSNCKHTWVRITENVNPNIEMYICTKCNQIKQITKQPQILQTENVKNTGNNQLLLENQ